MSIAPFPDQIIFAASSLDTANTARVLSNKNHHASMQALAVPLFACRFVGPLLANSVISFFVPNNSALSTFFIGTFLFLFLGEKFARVFEIAGIVCKCNMLICMKNGSSEAYLYMFWILIASFAGLVVFKIVTKNNHPLCLTTPELVDVMGTISILGISRLFQLHDVVVPILLIGLIFLKERFPNICCRYLKIEEATVENDQSEDRMVASMSQTSIQTETDDEEIKPKKPRGRPRKAQKEDLHEVEVKTTRRRTPQKKK